MKDLKKIFQRLLIFFVGLPLIIGIVFLLPHYQHLVLNLLVAIFSALGAVEFSISLSHKELNVSKAEAAVLGALPPLAMILIVNLGVSDLLIPAVSTGVVAWFLVSRTFSCGNKLDNFINQLTAGFAVFLYPGMLIAWMVLMSRWEQSSIIIITFLAIVFCTDGAAWAAGMLFGKGNQGFIPVSPNKSIAGFIGGTFASMVIGVGVVIFWSEVFAPKSVFIEVPWVAGILLGLLTGIAATLGDLGESAIKRSSGLKDSGSIIPGRGGVLDSIDSVTLAAPVFYLVFSLLFVQS